MRYTALLTDQYQLVMAHSYWKAGMAEQQATFHLSYRKLPIHSDFIVTAGLELAIEFLKNFHFSETDIAYLKTVTQGEEPLFEPEFLDYLSNLKFSCDVAAIPEGNLIFPREPVLRIQGPILQCQLLETPLLNVFNFSSLIATKAANLYQAAQSDTVIEFGLRRAQGPDGGLTASRSAYLGGCDATSNVLAGKLFNIPIQGTQAHSWIMAFPNELEAFETFAKIMGNHTVLLVDTFDTASGIKNAIKVGHQLQKQGQHLAGVRLDSGNLVELSRFAREELDKAGLTNTKIIASGDLDEHVIRELKNKKVPIDSWGVGTRLVTAHDQPALNGIYKLTAIKDAQGNPQYKMKFSDDPQKSTLPGILQVKRFENKQDVIYDELLGEDFAKGGKDLLQPIFKQGECIYQRPAIQDIRKNCIENVQQFVNESPKPYPVSVGKNLENIIVALMQQREGC